MKRIGIDFAPPGAGRTLRRATPLAWALLCAALPAAAALVVLAGRYRADEQETAWRMARLDAMERPRAAPAQAARPALAPARIEAVNAAVMQLNLPWRALHDAIQAGTPPGVALLALEPDAKKGRVRISAEARDSDAMIACVDSLRRSGWFGAVALLRHEIDEQDPNRPIRFQVDARWGTAP